MNKNLRWKVIVIVVTLLVFLFGIFGLPKSWSGSGLVSAMTDRIHLGLDLKGGTHLILQVQVNDAVSADSDRAIERLKDDLRSRKIAYSDITKPDPAKYPDRIVIKGVPPEGTTDLRNLINDRVPEYDATSGAENSWVLNMKPQQLTELKNRAVAQAIETIRNRVDKLGVSEPIIQEHGLGDYQILVQLPGVDDPARVKEIMQSTAMLEIRQAMNNGATFKDEQAALAAVNGVLPDNSVLMHGRNVGATGEDVVYIISRVSAVAGHDLREARVGRSSQTGYAGSQFLPHGRRRPSLFKFHVAARGRLPGRGARQQGDGGCRHQERDRRLGRYRGSLYGSAGERSGAHPELRRSAGGHQVFGRTHGRALAGCGFDSFRHSGGHHRDAGRADLHAGVLPRRRGQCRCGVDSEPDYPAGIPGIQWRNAYIAGNCGVILTVGMGVDSNVLIFERIREELRNGKTPPSAVDQGFAHAWITIVDTHVTTIVSAFILFIFGTGPVKGFAVTLTFGLLANLFTAVFVSRVIFDYVLSRKQRGEALSIG